MQIVAKTLMIRSLIMLFMHKTINRSAYMLFSSTSQGQRNSFLETLKSCHSEKSKELISRNFEQLSQRKIKGTHF